MPETTPAPGRPSPWWIVAAAAALVTAVLLLGTSVLVQREADRPIGEGELFVVEAEAAQAILMSNADTATTIDNAVRIIRNQLEIEAASVVDESGMVAASTSPTLVGTAVTNPFIAFAHTAQTFAAAAAPVSVPVVVDGVTMWDEGTTLYLVLRPLGDDRSLLLHYDISELLVRRSTAAGITSASLATAGLAIVLLLMSGVIVLGRIRANARFRTLAIESHLLEEHNAQLEDRNARLDDARRAAEEALQLAEEKNRIRAEFVLMINHELRTPLTSVITGARFLAEDTPRTAMEAEILDAMLRDGERLDEMISQILAVARIENRGLTAVVTQTESREVWEAICDQLPPTVETIHSAHLDDITVLTDATTLAQLIRSLVDNAFTHGANVVAVMTDNVTPPHEALRAGSPIHDGIQFHVIDDGPGIHPDFLPRAFEKFEKHGFSSGTGLGLYVARLMAEAISASISVASSSLGTTMTVTVPTATRRAVAEQNA